MSDSKKDGPEGRFSAEFQCEVVELLRYSGMTAAQVRDERGVSQSALYRWANARLEETLQTVCKRIKNSSVSYGKRVGS